MSAGQNNGDFQGPQPQHFGNFDRVKHINLDFTDVSVSQWRSRKTGLTMLHLDYEGAMIESIQKLYNLKRGPAPIVKGYFVVASES
jgi:hypothetical protein